MGSGVNRTNRTPDDVIAIDKNHLPKNHFIAFVGPSQALSSRQSAPTPLSVGSGVLGGSSLGGHFH